MTGTTRRWRRRLRRLLLGAGATLVALAVVAVTFVTLTRYPQGPPQTGVLALVGARTLVGPDLEPLDDATVLVRDGVIEAVGPRREVAVPPGAERRDLSGTTLLPGLIDLHVHLGAPEVDAGDEIGVTAVARTVVEAVRHAPSARRAFLEHGVTTLRSLGDDPAWVLELRRLVDSGELEGPRVVAAGPVFTTPGGHPVATIHGGRVNASAAVPATPDEARARVRELATTDGGVDLIKVVHERGLPDRPLDPIPVEVLDAIVAEAHRLDLPVVAHWGTGRDLDELLAAGVDGLEHLEPRGVTDPWPSQRIEALVRRQLPLGPTLAVGDAGPADDPAAWRAVLRHARVLHDAGVPLTAGSDAPMNGLRFGDGLHRELELLVEVGLTPTDALRAATSLAAAVLDDGTVGVLEPGRAADLLAVHGDPVADVTAVRQVAGVWRDGRLVVDHLDVRGQPAG